MNKHTYTQFDTELEHLQQRVLLMGAQVCQQITKAFDGYSNGDMSLIEDVIATEKSVNRDEVELDEMCVQLIARHSPTAGDLRLLMTLMQMVTDLERVGDEAKKIAKAARKIIDSGAAFVPNVELRHVVNLAVTMLNGALDAYVRHDLTAAAAIVRQDKEVDAIYKGVMRQLVTYMMEDPRLISRALDIIFIAKSIERIGDHATNIAEYVVYMDKGRDVRHESVEEIEKEARNAADGDAIEP
jgi:phosphate transport system protein